MRGRCEAALSGPLTKRHHWQVRTNNGDGGLGQLLEGAGLRHPIRLTEGPATSHTTISAPGTSRPMAGHYRRRLGERVDSGPADR